MSLKLYFYWLCSALGLRHRHQNHIRSNAGRGFWSLIHINVFPGYECAFDAFCKMLRKLQKAFVLLKQTASSDIQTLTWPPRKHKVVLGAGKKKKSDPMLGRTRLLRFFHFLHNAACVSLMWQWCVFSAEPSPFHWNLFLSGVSCNSRQYRQTKSKNNSIDQATKPTVDYIRSDHTQEMLFAMLCSSDQ